MYPFKFNKAWLSMGDFDRFVRHKWCSLEVDVDLSPMRTFGLKLRLLKAEVKSWERLQRKRDSEEMNAIETNIAQILIDYPAGIDDDMVLTHLKNLTQQQSFILKRREESAHQKSRIQWIESGDSNTRYYHQFANSRRLHNHIWDIQGVDGSILYKQGDLEEEAVTYFKSVYCRQENLPIGT